MAEVTGSVSPMNVLVVDDDPIVCRLVTRILSGEGHTVSAAYSGEEALDIGARHPFELVLCDVRIGEVDGFEVLRVFRETLQPDAEIVLITGFVSLEAALNAVKLGANDYICKPFTVEDLLRVARNAGERAALRERKSLSTGDAADIADRMAMFGRCPAMIEIFKTLGRVAATDLPVLICGESGTGKELVARALHANSDRGEKPFVVVSCGAFTEAALEAELFGSAQDASLGTASQRPGLFAEAEGGTILFDEITETTPAFQVRLLRVLQEAEVRSPGNNHVVPRNVRVLATTNQDIDPLVAKGAFRRDLMYLLNVVTISLPALRERGEDIELMVDAFLGRYSPPGQPVARLTPEARAKLLAWSWPGNVRELRHTIQRLVMLANNGIIRPDDLPAKIRDAGEAAERPVTSISGVLPSGEGQVPPSYNEVEKHYVEMVLRHTRGNKTQAAEIMGVDRKTLSRMIVRHDVHAEQHVTSDQPDRFRR